MILLQYSISSFETILSSTVYAMLTSNAVDISRPEENHCEYELLYDVTYSLSTWPAAGFEGDMACVEGDLTYTEGDMTYIDDDMT